ncbi:MAG TPA: coenzyme F420-0:L-glutamate ligase [Candidatus Baltobacteraceae bacterium]|nr:coenzyme F420-0:L-glutamate ligase [Candidatus Baltobacteraceae bacterium]
MAERSRFAVDVEGIAPGITALPVRTRLILAGDDLPGLVADAVRGIVTSDDVIAVSETPVAIAQNRAISAERIRPSRLAYALAARAGSLATVNQPESLQLVIDDVGVGKVLYASVMHAIGRLRGKRGVFYEILGEAISAIDGYTGTLPPFERMIVLGPENPDGVSVEIAERVGAHAVIVDANDLGIAKILGASAGVARSLIERVLRSNPHGNGDEQTPIVVLKWRGEGPNPLLERSP